MFGMGMGEIVLIAVVALLVLGPERLPSAAKAIGKGIRDLRQQSKELQSTIEADTQIGDAVREIRGALRGDPANIYKQVTGDDWNGSDSPSITSTVASAKAAWESDKEGDAGKDDDSKPDDDKAGLESKETSSDSSDAPETTEKSASSNAVSDLIEEEFANADDSWGEAPVNPHVANSEDNSPSNEPEPDNSAEPDMPIIRPAANTMARHEPLDDESDARNDSDNV